MELLKSIILGVVQGLTEFLPVSSDGHLAVFEWLLNMHMPGVTFEVMLHGGTLMAMIIYFFRDIKELTVAGLTGRDRNKKKLLWYIIAANIPTGIIGLFLDNLLENNTAFKSLLFVGLMFLVTGLIVWTGGRRIHKEGRELSFFSVIVLGIVQGIAALPGISRSGITISTGMILGQTQKEAARFSFLLAVPAIAGAFFLKLKDIGTLPGSASGIVLGFIFSLITGLFALKLLFKIVGSGKFKAFSYYCFAAGIITLALHMLRS